MSLQLLDLGVNPTQLTTLYQVGAKVDDLIVNAAGQLIYSVPSLGQVNLFDPTTGQNTNLLSGVKLPRDLTIEPNGQTMLVAGYSPGSIFRFNFGTGMTTLLAQTLKTCDGECITRNTGDKFNCERVVSAFFLAWRERSDP